MEKELRKIFEEEEYIICSGEGKGGQYLEKKKGKIFGEGNYLLQRSRKGWKYLKNWNVCFVDMKNDREGKGGNYLQGDFLNGPPLTMSLDWLP